MDLCHVAAILSQETQKALFMHSYPHKENEVYEVYEWGLCDIKLTMLMDSLHVHWESVNLISLFMLIWLPFIDNFHCLYNLLKI